MAIKQMTASGLGRFSEGKIANVLRTNPTNAKTAFIAILDEFGYYSVPGTSVIPAQARGLGFFIKLVDDDYQVILVDKNNYHQFPPLIYQVASGGLEPSSISFCRTQRAQHRADHTWRLP